MIPDTGIGIMAANLAVPTLRTRCSGYSDVEYLPGVAAGQFVITGVVPLASRCIRCCARTCALYPSQRRPGTVAPIAAGGRASSPKAAQPSSDRAARRRREQRQSLRAMAENTPGLRRAQVAGKSEAGPGDGFRRRRIATLQSVQNWRPRPRPSSIDAMLEQMNSPAGPRGSRCPGYVTFPGHFRWQQAETSAVTNEPLTFIGEAKPLDPSWRNTSFVEAYPGRPADAGGGQERHVTGACWAITLFAGCAGLSPSRDVVVRLTCATAALLVSRPSAASGQQRANA